MVAPRLSLAQQIAQLDEPTPIDFDPEDLQAGRGQADDDDDDAEVDVAAAREHYVDVGPSALRKLQAAVSDPKYEGVRTSRKQLEAEDEDDENDEDEQERDADDVDEDAGSDDQHAGEDGDGASEDDNEDIPSESEQEEREGRESESDAEETEPEKRVSPTQEPPRDKVVADDLSSMLQKSRESDRKKGKAVSRQIAVWDGLLDARIRLQKSVTATNRLPLPSDLNKFTTSTECQESLKRMLDEATLLSEELFSLQETLMSSDGSAKPPPRKRQRIQSDDAVSDPVERIQAATEDAVAFEHAYHPYLLQTLAKWSAKIQAVAPSVLLPSNRNAFSKNSQHMKSVIQLVDETLVDHTKLLARTQIPRRKGGRVGSAESAMDADMDVDADAEVFDDTDFYQQLLRDVIDARGNGAGGTDDWMVLQKQKKAKKKVDTKASKGRKLRYEVHEKLQNFMVPVPVRGMWHEEQIDELFASLLGKGFEHTGMHMTDVPDDRANGADAQLDDALNGGFKVFG